MSREYAVEVSGRRFDVTVIGEAGRERRQRRRRRRPPTGAAARAQDAAGAAERPGALVSPMQGTVLKVAVEKGAEVEEGALICVIEAMKMENEITAPVARGPSSSSACPRAAPWPPATPSPSSSRPRPCRPPSSWEPDPSGRRWPTAWWPRAGRSR